jgi:hypothetical protein
MPLTVIVDLPGGTREQYEAVVERMDLGGRMAPGGRFHTAGAYEGGWRVIDVWDDAAQFRRFAEEEIRPHTTAVGLADPRVRVIEDVELIAGSGAKPEVVQVVTMPGIDRETFRALDRKVRPDRELPAAISWHTNGPVEGGWCVVDAWTSTAERERFLEDRVMPVMRDASLQGEPSIEVLQVQATMPGAAAATA